MNAEVDEQPSRVLAQAAGGGVVAAVALGVAYELASAFGGAQLDQRRMHHL